MHNRGYHAFVDIFLSHSTEKFRRGTLLCFKKFLVSKTFIDKKGGGRECHNFPSKICCPAVPKNFVGEPFCVLAKSWYGKNLWIRGVEGGGVTIRNRKNIWHDRDSSRDLPLQNHVVLTPLLSFIFE